MSLLFQGYHKGIRRFAGGGTPNMPSAFSTFTICGFAKLIDGPSIGGNTLLSFMDSVGNSGSDISIGTSNDLRASTGWGAHTSDSVATITEGGSSGANWFFWGLRFNGFGNNTRLYFRSLSGGTIVYVDVEHDSFGSPSWGGLLLGRHLFNGPSPSADEDTYNTYSLNGYLAHIKWYNSSLSDAEVNAESYSLAPVLTTNLLSYHTFDESTLSACYEAQQGSGTWEVFDSAPSLSTDNPTLTTWPTLGGTDTLPSGSSSGATPVTMYGGWSLPSTRAVESISESSVVVSPHSAMQDDTDSVVITYPITAKRADGTAISFTKTQTLAKVKSGTSGTVGAQGPRGATAIAIQMAAGVSSWSVTAAETEMQNQGLWPPVRNDRVTQFNTTFAKTFFYAGTGTYSQANWQELVLFIDGGAVITGTLSGAAIISDTLEATKLTVGAAGTVPNMLKNSDWVEVNRSASNDPLSLKDWVYGNNGITSRLGYRRHGSHNFGLGGMWMYDDSNVGSGIAQYVYQDVAAEASVSYEFSVYVALHRCTGYIYIQWFGAGDSNLGNTTLDATTLQNPGTGYYPSGGGAGGIHAMGRLWGKVTSPSGTVKARFHIVKHATNAGSSPANSYLFAHRAMMCKAPTNASVSNKTQWNDGGVTTIDGGAIVTASITAATGVIADAAITTLKIAGQNVTTTNYMEFPGPYNTMVGQNGGQVTQNAIQWDGVFNFIVAPQRIIMLMSILNSVVGGATNVGGRCYFRTNGGGWTVFQIFNLSSAGNFTQPLVVFAPMIPAAGIMDVRIELFNDYSSSTAGTPVTVTLLFLATLR